MSGSHAISPDTSLILEEIQALRHELSVLREETRATIGGIRALFDEIRQVEASEASIEMELGQMAERVGQVMEDQQFSLTTCQSCGSAIERHKAKNGVLLICKACGHTAFSDRRKISDRRGGEECRVQGQVVAEGMPAGTEPASFDWTRE